MDGKLPSTSAGDWVFRSLWEYYRRYPCIVEAAAARLAELDQAEAAAALDTAARTVRVKACDEDDQELRLTAIDAFSNLFSDSGMTSRW